MSGPPDPGLMPRAQGYEQQNLSGTANNIWQAIQALARTLGNFDADFVAGGTASGTSLAAITTAINALTTATNAVEAAIAAKQTVVIPGTLSWVAISTSQNVSSPNFYAVSTTAGAVTATLPASPNTNDYLYFMDSDGTLATHNLTLGRNGHLINGATSNLVMSTNGQFIGLVYGGATPSWRTFSS